LRAESLGKTPAQFSKLGDNAEHVENPKDEWNESIVSLDNERNKHKSIKKKQREYQNIVNKFDKVRQCMFLLDFESLTFTSAKSRKREEANNRTPEHNSKNSSNPFKRVNKPQTQDYYASIERKKRTSATLFL